MTEFNEYNLPADFDDLSKHAPLLEKIRAKGDGFVLPENYFHTSAEEITTIAKLTDNRQPTTDNGFTVPENYFDELAERIIAIVQLSSADNRQLTTDNSFTVPEGYFEKLTDEIIAVAQLADLKSESFRIPDSYFNELDETIATKIALDNLKQDEGFTVPENYFDKFTDKILTQISVNELNKSSHVSSLKSHVSGADVPAGYFDTLADRIAERIADEEGVETGKTVERGRIIVFAEVLKRYARPISVAASVTLILSLGIWFFNRGGEKVEFVDVKRPKENIQPVIPTPKKDSVIITVQPENNIAVQPKIKKQKPPVNLNEEVAVKAPDSEDILEQLYLLDENTVADYIIENPEVETPVQEESLNEEMMQYLLDTNLDPSDIK